MAKKNTPVHSNIEIHAPAEGELSRYKKQDKDRQKYKKSNRNLLILGGALVILFFYSAAVFVSFSWSEINFAYYIQLSREKIADFLNFVVGSGAKDSIQFVTYRYIIIVLVGASLAASGALYQGAFRNILASPTTLGVESGGMVGNIIYVTFFVSTGTTVFKYDDSVLFAKTSIWQSNFQQFLVLAGCFVAVFLVVGMAAVISKGTIKPSSLIVAGIIFSTVIGMLASAVQYYMLAYNSSDSRVYILQALLMGSFDRSFTFEHMIVILCFIVPCLILLLCLSGRLNLLVLGEDEASTMGMNVRVFRYAMIALSTLLTSVVIAFCGQIGFIGFIVPQAARRLVGPDYRKMMPGSMLIGAILLLVVYDIATLIGFASYINLLISVMGSIVMVYAFVKGQGRTNEG